MWIRSILLIFYGLCAGGLIAASFLAFLSMLGVIPRLAGLTKSIKYARAYESFVAAGGILGTLAFIYRWSIRAGYWLLAAYGGDDQKSSDFFKEIKTKVRDSICYLWNCARENVWMLYVFLYIPLNQSMKGWLK